MRASHSACIRPATIGLACAIAVWCNTQFWHSTDTSRGGDTALLCERENSASPPRRAGGDNNNKASTATGTATDTHSAASPTNRTQSPPNNNTPQRICTTKNPHSSAPPSRRTTAQPAQRIASSSRRTGVVCTDKQPLARCTHHRHQHNHPLARLLAPYPHTGGTLAKRAKHSKNHAGMERKCTALKRTIYCALARRTACIRRAVCSTAATTAAAVLASKRQWLCSAAVPAAVQRCNASGAGVCLFF